MPVNIGQQCTDKQTAYLVVCRDTRIDPRRVIALTRRLQQLFDIQYRQHQLSMAVNLTKLLLCEIPIVYGISGRMGLFGRWCDGKIIRATGRGRGTYR